MFDLYLSYFKVFALFLAAILLFVLVVVLIIIIINFLVDFLLETRFDRRFLKYKKEYLNSVKKYPADFDKQLKDYVKYNS